jgi:hypothetical protein
MVSTSNIDPPPSMAYPYSDDVAFLDTSVYYGVVGLPDRKCQETGRNRMRQINHTHGWENVRQVKCLFVRHLVGDREQVDLGEWHLE